MRLFTLLLLLGLSFGTSHARACPEGLHAIGYTRSGAVWELTIPSEDVPRVASADVRAALAAHLSPQVVAGLLASQGLLALMDEVASREGVVVVGVGDRLPVTVAPAGMSPFSAIASIPTAGTPRSGLAALGTSWGVRTGEVRPAEALLGHDQLLLLVLARGRVALLTPTGFVRYDGALEERVSATGGPLDARAAFVLERNAAASISLRSAGGAYLRWGRGGDGRLDARGNGGRADLADAQARFYLAVSASGACTLTAPPTGAAVALAASTRGGR
jgi:hypothetical protein